MHERAKERKINVVRRRCIGHSIAKFERLRKIAKKIEATGKKEARTTKRGTWNVRRLGAISGPINQFLKTKCILRMCECRKWSFCILTDLTFEQNSVREFDTEKGKWTMIIQGKVGSVVDEESAGRWRVAGANGHDSG